MLIKQLSVQRFLSFDHNGIDVEMRDLNVLIGPNGSGKSNFLEVLAVLQGSPKSFGARMKQLGPLRDWAWRATQASGPSSITTQLFDAKSRSELAHVILFDLENESCTIISESVLSPETNPTGNRAPYVYKLEVGEYTLWDSQGKSETFPAQNLERGESILSQVRDPSGRYSFLRALQTGYDSMRLYRSWGFGPSASVRRAPPTDLRVDHLTDGAENLALKIKQMYGGIKRDLVEHLGDFIHGVESIKTLDKDKSIQLLLDEGNGREIPATRLSDGTLRYLALLAILLDPEPPSLIAIEEPELGLHPDVLPGLGKLIKKASSRMQIVITTHSQILLDAFSETPEDVVVCSRGPTGSVFERLSAEKLEDWLKDHTLGELWNMGEIGGNGW
jgi:predicted ATPase